MAAGSVCGTGQSEVGALKTCRGNRARGQGGGIRAGPSLHLFSGHLIQRLGLPAACLPLEAKEAVQEEEDAHLRLR